MFSIDLLKHVFWGIKEMKVQMQHVHTEHITFSPAVFILLLAENSFSCRVTSLNGKNTQAAEDEDTREKEGEGFERCFFSVSDDWLNRWSVKIKKRMYSLGHLRYVFVSQAHPQVIVLVQQHLLLTRVSDATGLIPEGERKDTSWLKDTTWGVENWADFHILYCNLSSSFHLFNSLAFVRTCRRRSRWAAGRSPWPGRWAHAGQVRRGRTPCPGWSAVSEPCLDPTERVRRGNETNMHILWF